MKDWATPLEPGTGLAESLVAVAAEALEGHSESAVRTRTLGAFAKQGIQAAFARVGQQGPVSLCQEALPEWMSLDCAVLATDSKKAIFEPSATNSKVTVYLPILRADGEPEILALEGSRYDGEHRQLLGLFARQLTAALERAHLTAEAERRNEELGVVADVASLAAGPGQVPLPQLLRQMARALNADVVMLHAEERERGALLLLAHVDLPPELAANFAEISNPSGMLGLDPMSMPEGACRVEGAPVYAQTQGRYECAAVLPLHFGGETHAVLTVLTRDASSLPPAAIRLLETLGDLLASALERRRLREEASRQLIETALLLELTRITSGSLELAYILDAACDFLVKLLDVSNCFILLLDSTGHVLRGAAASMAHRDFFRNIRIPLDSQSVAAAAARTRVPVVIEDVKKSAIPNPEMVAHLGEKSVMALPLIARDELVGAVVVDDVRCNRDFAPQFIALAEATAGQLALSVQNAKLYESLKESYAQLARTRAEMVKQERLAALGELSAIVAHEVRNPLGVIFNAVSSLKRLTKAEGDAGALLTIVREECERLDRIVNDLLDFSRPAALNLELSELKELLDESVEVALVNQPPSAYRVDVDVESELPKVAVDRHLLRQALVNVMINGLQAMPRGGALGVTAARDGDSHVSIRIMDQGRGVPLEVAPRIFEPFFSTKAKGTGLGLAVVRRILEDHHGDVTLRSPPGEGATFTLRLPIEISKAVP